MGDNVTHSIDTDNKLFPSWIMHNFKKYILPKIKIDNDLDPCDLSTFTNELTLYQKFVGQYLNYNSNVKNILLYHGVGSGKTRTVINLYNSLYNYNSNWNVILLIPALLHDDPWMKEFQLHIDKNDYNDRLSNINIIHYDAPNAYKIFTNTTDAMNKNKKTIFIIDEAHRFISNVFNSIEKKSGKVLFIYDYIKKFIMNNNSARVVLLSATPVVNNPYEFALIFNLLRPNIFPNSNKFKDLFINDKKQINEENKNMFQRRILGLVSYYIGSTPDKFASKNIINEKLEMTEYQEEIYTYFENIEKRKSLKSKGNNSNSSYMTYTRQSCNFVFPYINNKVSGEKRPRPSVFKLSTKIIDKLDNNNEELKNSFNNNKNIIDYLNTVELFVTTLEKYLIDIDNKSKVKLVDDINDYTNKYKLDFDDFMKNKNNKSNLFNELYKLSPKFVKIIFNIEKTKGTVMVYSNYVSMEGLQIFKIYLSLFNYSNLTSKENTKYKYCEFHGKIDKEERNKSKKIFNSVDNKYGKKCKLIMISPAGSEGITLSNVRQVHIVEPYWNEVRIEQVIGRAVRFCQHKDLPLNERVVDIYRYKMTKSISNVKTTDEIIEEISLEKHKLLSSFIDAVKEAAVDCALFKNHNMMNIEYNCFNFNNTSILNNSSPAYTKDISIDKKFDDGLNSKNSIVRNIKVYKIKAVKQLSNNLYSSVDNYLIDFETNILYDNTLHYPIGYLMVDNDNNNVMYNDDTYVFYSNNYL